MGRQESNHDPSVVVHSSIALLQERFRQLQKVKEMREERELIVRLLSLSKPNKHGSLFNTCVLFDPSVARFFSHPELMMMQPPTTTTRMTTSTTTSTTMLTLPETSLSLWPTLPSQGKKLGVGVGVGVDVTPLMNLWPVDNTTSTTSSCDSTISLISKLDHDHDHNYESNSNTDVDTSLHL